METVSPRNSVEGAIATREAILTEAVDRASLEGLEGITIGGLADSLRMSKAGVIGQFGNKEALQLATLRAASVRFRTRIWDPAAAKPEGIARLRAIARSWIAYLEGDTFPGGCFLTAASTEFDGRPGPVHDEVERTVELWHRVLEREAAAAIAAGELEGDPEQIAFEMNAVAMAVNQARQLRHDPRAGKRGRAAMKRILGG
jgi:AcrR family transcriptional regulator